MRCLRKDAPLLLQRADQRTFQDVGQTHRLNRNHERQARHLRGDQLRQDQAEEDGDAGEELPAIERDHRTGEGSGDVMKPLPPVMHCTPPLLLPSSSSCIALFSVTSFSLYNFVTEIMKR